MKTTSLITILTIILSLNAWAQDCVVATKQSYSTSTLTEVSKSNLEKLKDESLADLDKIIINNNGQNEFSIDTHLLVNTDPHSGQRNAMIAMSIYHVAQNRLISYSHHFGKTFRVERKAGSEANFKRALLDSVKSIKSCSELRKRMENPTR